VGAVHMGIAEEVEEATWQQEEVADGEEEHA